MRPHGKTSIRGRILRLVWIALLLMTLVAVLAISSMRSFYRQYDQSVQNITHINIYNVDFEKEMNRSMYYIIVETYDWEELKDTDDPNNPYWQIRTFREGLNSLKESTDDITLLTEIEAISKMLDSLEKRVDDIIHNIEIGGLYDENMQMLSSNINVLTSLIQKDIEEYISQEVSNMEQVQQILSNRVQWFLTMLILLVVILLLSVIYVSARISKKITDPINRMCSTTMAFASGDFSVRAQVGSGDEMDTLAQSFNSMVTEISQLVEDIRIQQKNAKDAELKLLQAQINPHFLYNTLDAIMWLVESGQNEQAVSMVSSLSSFFRTTLSKGRDWITVSEERDHIRSYLEIQQFRYADILEYEVDIPEKIGEYYVMKLMLQPIVENALYHGIKNKRGMGKIIVEGRESGSDLVFIVSDNGIGMTEQQLLHMRKLISGEIANDSQPNGFGIANVEQRIRLHYGSQYGIMAESTFGEGSTITVRIPKVLTPKAMQSEVSILTHINGGGET